MSVHSTRCFGFLIGIAVMQCGRVSAANEVAVARVHWSGDCDDRAALGRAMSARGAALVEISADPTKDPTRIAPNPDELAVDVAVHPGPDGKGRTAQLYVANSRGGFEQREVEALQCGELRAAVAWVLVVLAKERRAAEAIAAVPSSMPSSSVPTSPPVDRAEPTKHGPTELPRPASPSSALALRGRVTLLPHPERPFTVGSSFAASFLFLKQPLIGPELFVEYRPWGNFRPAFRLTLLQLSSSSLSVDGTQVNLSVRRRAARVSVSLDSSELPIGIVGAIEAGILMGSGSGAITPGSETVRWLSALLGLVSHVPLLHDRLELELGTLFGLVPYSYAFQVQNGASLVESRQFEVRMQAGLGSRF